MKDFFKKLFHKHTYEQTGYREKESNNVRYSVRRYECKECNKVRWVDGRNDPFQQ